MAPTHAGHLCSLVRAIVLLTVVSLLLLACYMGPDRVLIEEDTVRRLDPSKLHVEWTAGSTAEGPLLPRTYTLTHSDSTGELYLTIGLTYDADQVSGWYTRLMRDEVLAEWLLVDGEPQLHVYCHVSGGLVAGSASLRDAIFRRELPLVLEAFRFGDQQLFVARPELDTATVWVHFHSTNPKYNVVEPWGKLAEYR